VVSSVWAFAAGMAAKSRSRPRARRKFMSMRFRRWCRLLRAGGGRPPGSVAWERDRQTIS
jgi:hypothetical protein